MNNTIHGMRNEPEYYIWCAMKARCLNPKDPSYDYYGGRGITVCEEWQEDFMSFFDDMGPRPSGKHSLDRVDNNGDYEPGNCKWATKQEQTHNRRVRAHSTNYTGVHLDNKTKRYRVYLKNNYKQIYIGTFDTEREAVVARDKYIITNNLPHQLSPMFLIGYKRGAGNERMGRNRSGYCNRCGGVFRDY